MTIFLTEEEHKRVIPSSDQLTENVPETLRGLSAPKKTKRGLSAPKKIKRGLSSPKKIQWGLSAPKELFKRGLSAPYTPLNSLPGIERSSIAFLEL